MLHRSAMGIAVWFKVNAELAALCGPRGDRRPMQIS
jgi:hypothetical protein